MAREVVFSSTIGANHVRQNLPNQDALKTQVKDPFVMMALADGHGSEGCFRSHLGAQMAVDAAIDVLATTDLSLLDDYPEEKLTAWTKQWAEKTLMLWVKNVLDHLKEHPFEPDEVGNLTYKHRRTLGKNALYAYGSTLMAALVTKAFLLGYNIGDGDWLVYQGDQVTNYHYKDDSTLGNATYSLCVAGSLQKAAYVVRSMVEKPDLIFLATDGYHNSFRTTEGFYQVGKDVLALYRRDGIGVIAENLEAWTRDTSDQGSGDDVSVVMVFCVDEVKGGNDESSIDR